MTIIYHDGYYSVFINGKTYWATTLTSLIREIFKVPGVKST